MARELQASTVLLRLLLTKRQLFDKIVFGMKETRNTRTGPNVTLCVTADLRASYDFLRRKASMKKLNSAGRRLLAGAFLVVSGTVAMASTDPTDIITSAEGKYGAAVAIFIAAAVIGAAIMFIRKGLRGRM